MRMTYSKVWSSSLSRITLYGGWRSVFWSVSCSGSTSGKLVIFMAARLRSGPARGVVAAEAPQRDVVGLVLAGRVLLHRLHDAVAQLRGRVHGHRQGRAVVVDGRAHAVLVEPLVLQAQGVGHAVGEHHQVVAG